MPLVQLLPTRLRLTVLWAKHNAAALRDVWRGPRRALVRSSGVRTDVDAPRSASVPSPVAGDGLQAPSADGARASPAPSRPSRATAEGTHGPMDPVARQPTQGSTFRVGYLRSGVTLDVASTETLLEAALDAGLDLAHACQMGMCGTCKSRLVSGNVEMDEPNTLSDEERARGFCLPCVSHPLGPVELDA